jgi:hypothetical protein
VDGSEGGPDESDSDSEEVKTTSSGCESPTPTESMTNDLDFCSDNTSSNLDNEEDNEEDNEDNEEDNEDDESSGCFYAVIKNMPVQSSIYEDLEGPIDNLLYENKTSEKEWLAILFQLCFSLAVAQKEYGFVHNDLHSNNVMWSNTSTEYLYYNIGGTIFKIPTFGKIIKIIDFGRAYIRFQGREYFSDAFHPKGDATGQYNYPPYFKNTESMVPPNPSFDLPRLACAIYEALYSHIDDDDSPLRLLLEKWLIDSRGKNILWNRDGVERFAGFGLYKHIARFCNNSVPLQEIENQSFLQFKISTESIPEDTHIFSI